MLQAADAPDINIICEKVAFDGVTRFEDRFRLPLGVTVNLTDYSAQLATEVRHAPLTLCQHQHQLSLLYTCAYPILTIGTLNP